MAVGWAFHRDGAADPDQPFCQLRDADGERVLCQKCPGLGGVIQRLSPRPLGCADLGARISIACPTEHAPGDRYVDRDLSRKRPNSSPAGSAALQELCFVQCQAGHCPPTQLPDSVCPDDTVETAGVGGECPGREGGNPPSGDRRREALTVCPYFQESADPLSRILPLIGVRLELIPNGGRSVGMPTRRATVLLTVAIGMAPPQPFSSVLQGRRRAPPALNTRKRRRRRGERSGVRVRGGGPPGPPPRADPQRPARPP